MPIPKHWSTGLVREKLQLSPETEQILKCADRCQGNDEIWIFFKPEEIQKEEHFTPTEKEFCLAAFQKKRYPGPLIWHRPAGFDAYDTYSPVHTCRVCHCGHGTEH